MHHLCITEGFLSMGNIKVCAREGDNSGHVVAGSLAADLRSRFNPDGSQLRRLQLRMLDILLEIDRICQKHHIRYWLSSGPSLVHSDMEVSFLGTMISTSK